MPEIFDFLIDKSILIIGPPGSGKTFLSKKLSLNRPVVHTDEYLKTSSHSLLKNIMNKPFLVEGCLGYNLLRNGYCPDIVIEIDIDEKQVAKIENIRGKKYSSFNKANKTILNDYFNKTNILPIWIKVTNKYAGNF